MAKEGFSIVICCYNSSERLAETLRHVSLLTVPPGIPCELLVINNASTDNTIETVNGEWLKSNSEITLRLINEPLLGLSNARKAGFSAALYNYVVWCDDDNWLRSDYLVIALNIFNTQKNIGIIGGCGKPFPESAFPEWLRSSESLFAIGRQEKRSGSVRDKRVYGAGAIIYKPAYEEIISAGFKQLLTDRLGNHLASGGDYELCYAIALAGFSIWYEETLEFTHYFPL